MNENLWMKETFMQDDSPEWPCPVCGKGVLKLSKDTLQEKETKESQSHHNHEDWDCQWIDALFTAFFECGRCGDLVAVVGKWTGGIFSVNDYGPGGYYETEANIYTPKYFLPALKLISIPEKCPESVKAQIEGSFRHAFDDYDAAVNAIRKSLELLMNEWKINKTYTSPGGGRSKRKKSLHSRIKDFQTKNNREVGELLLAIKWIGNDGSHSSTEPIDRKTLIDTYRILEHALHLLYDTEAGEIKRIAKRIIRKKSGR